MNHSNSQSLRLFAVAITMPLFAVAFASAQSTSTQPGAPDQKAGEETVKMAQSTSTQPGAPDQKAGEEIVKMAEVIVTGSYIPQSSFGDAGSPVNIQLSSDIAMTGGISKASDYMRFATQNLGGFDEGNLDAQSRWTGGGSVNLRGLGAGATLVLLNGYRQTRDPLGFVTDGRVDINTLAPNIDIERIETLLDGASSLYGSDAVGGVVNFITRDDFNGTEIRTSSRSISDYNFRYGRQYTESILVGGQVSEKLHVTASFEYMKQTEGPTGGQTGLNKYALATYGAIFGVSSGFPGNFSVPVRNASGQLTGTTTLKADPSCGQIQQQGINVGNPQDVGGDTVLLGGLCRDLFQAFPFLEDQNRWIGRSSFTRKLNDRLTLTGDFVSTRSSVYNFIFAGVSGTSTHTIIVPGTNPGNTYRAVDSLGQPLYAVPNPLNPTVPLLDANGNAVLTSNPTNSASGIPFNENVIIGSWRPFSATNAPIFTSPNINTTVHGDVGLLGKINPIWSWNLNYTYSWASSQYTFVDTIYPNLVAGLNCQLTVGKQTNLCYNPFGTSALAQPGSPQYNTPAVISAIYTNGQNHYTTTLGSLDGVVNGKLGSLPAGPMGVAIGFQSRHESLLEQFDKAQEAGALTANPGGQTDFNGAMTDSAAFAEVRVPIFKNSAGKLDLSASARYDRDNLGDHSFNPKASFSYKRGWLNLKGSYGTSFLAPDLYQRFGQTYIANVGGVVDPLYPSYLTQPAGITGGSPTAQPQKSQSYNFGVTVEPIKSLTLSANYWRFNFTNLLTTLSNQATVNANPRGPDVVRDPITDTITLLKIHYFNAGSLNLDGVDLQANWNSPSSAIGRFNLFGAATVVCRYDAQVTTTSPVIRGVSTDNSNNFNYAMPKWRINTGVAWDRREQSASVIVRYISRVYVATAKQYSAHPQTKVDFQYNYDLKKLVSGLKLTVGVLNLLDSLPNYMTAPTYQALAYMSDIQDPTPRRVYVTLDYSF